MTPLPERKKSPEEIARLREALGAVPPKPFAPPAPAVRPEPAPAVKILSPPSPEPAASLIIASPPPSSPPPLDDAPPATKLRPVRSLKRSERAAFRMVEEPPTPAPLPSPPPTHFPQGAKRQRIPTESPPPSTSHSENSKIPAVRHSDREISDMRRRDTIAMLHPTINPKLLPAHPAMLAPGYIAPILTILCVWLLEQPIHISTPSCGVSLLLATFIAIRKPISRHHAGFMAVISIAVLICAAFHYFPQLVHAT